MAKNKILLSLSAHESEWTLLDLCLNYLFLGMVNGIVIHVNSISKFNKQLFGKLVSKIPGLNGRIFLNPYSTSIEQHSRHSQNVTNLHRAHISNFFYAINSGFNFDYICLDASNSLIIKPGLKDYICQTRNGGIGSVSLDPKWFWHDNVLGDSNITNDKTSIKVSPHEGAFFERTTFIEISRLVLLYDRKDTGLLLLDEPRPEYPREEVLFSTYFYKIHPGSSTADTYIFMPWEKNLHWSLHEVAQHIQTGFNSFGSQKFGIKRVQRDINDPIRVLIGNNYGYRRDLLKLVDS